MICLGPPLDRSRRFEFEVWENNKIFIRIFSTFQWNIIIDSLVISNMRPFEYACIVVCNIRCRTNRWWVLTSNGQIIKMVSIYQFLQVCSARNLLQYDIIVQDCIYMRIKQPSIYSVRRKWKCLIPKLFNSHICALEYIGHYRIYNSVSTNNVNRILRVHNTHSVGLYQNLQTNK